MAIGRKRDRFCIVSRNVTADSFLKDPDHDRHPHIGWQEINTLFAENALQPISGLEIKDISDERESTPDYIFEWLTGSVIRYKRHIPTRGMSSKFGEYLARAVKAKEPWAEAMMAQMRGELETACSVL